MAKGIPAILNDDQFTPLQNRFFTVFKPIQATKRLGGKHSDFLAYLVNPVIDVLLIPGFLLDVAISLTNMVISFVNALHVWSHNQQSTPNLADSKTRSELWDMKEHFVNAVASLLSAVLNPIFSLLSLVTRPVASLVTAVAEACDECSSASHRI